MTARPTGRVVAVTGAAGRLGRAVVRRLAADPAIAEVRALDLVALPATPSVRPVIADVCDPALAATFAGCDTVVHLAFVVERGSRDRARTARINLDGTRNTVEAAAAAGVGHVVVTSSTAAYGVQPPSDGPLDESAPLLGSDTFYYADHKAQNERWLDTFEAAHPEVAVARLRPCVVLGPDSARLFQRPRLFAFRGLDVPAHLVHEDDVADAVALLVHHGTRGAFNCVADAPLRMSGVADALGKPAGTLPAWWLGLADLAFRFGWLPIDPAWVRFGASQRFTVSAARLRSLGWTPRYPTTADVARAVAAPPALPGSAPHPAA